MKDQIVIKDIEVYTKIGCTASERMSLQKVCFDLALTVDGSKAALSKELKDSVCYLTLTNSAREFIASREWVLVEELSYSLAKQCLEKFMLIEEIEVTLRKFVVPATSYISFRTNKKRE